MMIRSSGFTPWLFFVLYMNLAACTGVNSSRDGGAVRPAFDSRQGSDSQLIGDSSSPDRSPSIDTRIDTFSNDTLSKDTLSKDTSSKDTSSKDTSSKDTFSNDTSSNDTSSNDTRADSLTPTGQRSTFFVKGKDIFDSCGEKFIARGVNHPTLYVDRSGESVPEIAMTKSNIVRLFWFAGNGVPITEAEPIITKLENAGIVSMLEMHDSTCEWSLDKIKSYWTSKEAVALIGRHQRSFMLNIANEASYPNGEAFVSKYTEIILAIRAVGIKVPLVIDGGECGRDSDVLLNRGAELVAADPEHNVIFSWHFYDPLSKNEITKVFTQSITNNLPFMVGEFAHKSPPGCGANLDYKFMIAEAQRLGIGWLAWSWGDDDEQTWWNSDCSEFDMTRSFAFSSLEGWGREVAVSDPNSIKNTAVPPRGLTGSCQ